MLYARRRFYDKRVNPSLEKRNAGQAWFQIIHAEKKL
jgi:hypothetical protein